LLKCTTEISPKEISLTADSQSLNQHNDPQQWEEFYDSSAGAKYWFNNFTGEAQWEDPPEIPFASFCDEESLTNCESLTHEVETVLEYKHNTKIPSSNSEMTKLNREKKESKQIKDHRQLQHQQYQAWTSHFDHESGHAYWYNRKTEECTWENPTKSGKDPVQNKKVE